MKRIIVTLLLLSIAAVMPVFSGGSQEDSADQIETEKLVLWHNHTEDDGFKGIIEEAVKDFKKNEGIEIEIVTAQNDPYKTKLKVVMGSGTPPDIIHSWGGGPLKAYVDAGMIEPIDSIKDELLNRYSKGSFDPVTFNGKTYGSAYAGISGVYFWYRKDIFDKYGLSVPKTWSEFLAVCETLKNNDITPIALANNEKWPGSFYYMYLADRLGGSDLFLDAIYRNGKTFEDPSYVKAGELLQDLVRNNYFAKGINGMDTGQSRMLLYSGKVAMRLMGNWFYSSAKKEYPEGIDNIGLFAFPEIEGGKGDPTNVIGSPGQNYFSVTSGSKNKAAALLFLKDYVMNDKWIQGLVDSGRIPPAIGASAMVSDPISKKIALTFEEAGHVQVYYDQFLSPTMGEAHKDIVQSLFGLEITPADAASQHESGIQKEISN
jgi:ABC-type glycerol-3-phosphate transport system substrate-binding protein